MKTFLKIIFLCLSIGVFVPVLIKSIQINQNCLGYLKRAADANAIETAHNELNRAITYMEQNNLTKGYTSILWRTPNDDIGFFYNNLVSSRDELTKVTTNASSLEKSNVLMKLRETLLDEGKSGTELTCPPGLSRFPYNLQWAILMWIAGLAIAGVIVWIIIDNWREDEE